MPTVSMTVNGKVGSADVEPRTLLVHYIRDHIGLTGTHVGCEHGVCGACTVIYDGAPVRSCSLLAVQADGMEINTVEGLCNEDGSTGVLQDAFRDAHAMQCGYCTPGMLVAADALLKENSEPSLEDIKEAIGGNICRCTGYVKIVEAVQAAAVEMHEGGAA